MDREAARLEMEARIISWQKDQFSSAGGFFDCGSLGVLYLYWVKSSWQTWWATVDPRPAPLVETADDA